MARKRVSEKDLLEFQARTEALSREVERKYDMMDKAAKPEPKPEPIRDTGVMLIHDAASDMSQLAALEKRLAERGCAVEKVDLFGYKLRDRFDRTPEWQKWLEQAQSGYLQVSKRAERVCVIGAGGTGVLAALISEQYPVDLLVTVGGGPRMRFGLPALGRSKRAALSKIARIARNNMFSIVCPIINIVTDTSGEFKRESVSMYRTDTRSSDVRRIDMSAEDVDCAMREMAEEVAKAVSGYMNRE